jgi:hypothetical protein
MSQRKPAATAVATCSGCDYVLEGRMQVKQGMSASLSIEAGMACKSAEISHCMWLVVPT